LSLARQQITVLKDTLQALALALEQERKTAVELRRSKQLTEGSPAGADSLRQDVNQPSPQDRKSMAKVLESMPAENAAKILRDMPEPEARQVLLILKKRQAAKILSTLEPDRAARMMR
jgi:flagellar motility protein MotE (MotC chaperone)